MMRNPKLLARRENFLSAENAREKWRKIEEKESF